jgi:hypothetical protein
MIHSVKKDGDNMFAYIDSKLSKIKNLENVKWCKEI